MLIVGNILTEFVYIWCELGLGDATSKILDLIQNVFNSLFVQLMPQDSWMVPHVILGSFEYFGNWWLFLNMVNLVSFGTEFPPFENFRNTTIDLLLHQIRVSSNVISVDFILIPVSGDRSHLLIDQP